MGIPTYSIPSGYTPGALRPRQSTAFAHCSFALTALARLMQAPDNTVQSQDSLSTLTDGALFMLLGGWPTRWAGYGGWMDRMDVHQMGHASAAPPHTRRSSPDHCTPYLPSTDCQRLDVDDAHPEHSALFWPLVPSRRSLCHLPSSLWLSTERLPFSSSLFGSLNLHSLFPIIFSSSLACSRFLLRVPTTAVPPCLQTASASPQQWRADIRRSTSLTYTDPSYRERAVCLYLVLIRTYTSHHITTRHDTNHGEFHQEP